MASNSHGLTDEDGEFSDWIELHNTGTEPVSLLNWSLTDNPANLLKWRFPATNLPPGGYLVVFASNKDRRVPGAPLHTNFRLDAGGEYLALVGPDGTTVAHAFAPAFTPQVTDVSFGISSQAQTSLLLDSASPVRILVPGDNHLETAWTSLEFEDDHWLTGTNGIGFGAGGAGWAGGPAPNVVYAATPVGFWRLTETNGVTVLNQGSYGQAGDGALAAGATPGFAGPAAPLFPGFETPNRAVHFDGVNGKIDVPYAPELNPPVFTVSLWAKVNGGSSTFRSPLTSRNTSPVRGYVIYAGDNNLWQFWTGAGTGDWHAQTGPAVVSGRWYHLAGSFDGVTKRFYVNGALVAQSLTGYQPNNARPLRIGAGATETSGQYFFNGDVDEVAVFPRALADNEILGLFQAATNAASASGYAGLIHTDIGGVMSNHQSSAYFRFPFVITNLANLDGLVLRMKYDDGFAAYLNGQPAVSSHAPPNLAWNSTATEEQPNSAGRVFEEFDLSDLRDFLLPGTNLLAIQGLNRSIANEDFLVLPELEATFQSGLDSSPRYFRLPTPGAENSAGQAELGPILTHVGFTPAPPIKPLDGDPITVTARVSVAFSPVTNMTLRYRVMFRATNSLPMLDDGQHGDGAAGDGIFGAVIPAGESTPGQMVRFQVWANDSAGRLSRWPLFESTNNSPAWLGTVVANPAVTSSLPIWEWFAENVNNARNRTGTRGAVFFNGAFHDHVFIRERGGFTSIGSQKFDFNTGDHLLVNDEVGRVEEANLNANGLDPSYIRPPLAFESFRAAGNHSSITFPVLMRVNGGVDRVANFIEQVDERFLERRGYDRHGALYKFVQRSQLTPAFSDSTDGIEKKTRSQEGRADLQAVVTALRLTNGPAQLAQRAAFLFDNLNLAQVINYMAVENVLRDDDNCRKNFYFYRDTDGTREWHLFPWDKDICLGIVADGMPNLPHPLFGSYAYRKINPVEQWNMLWDALFTTPRIREMYLRRLRTVMDEVLQPTKGYFESRADAWFAPAFPHLGAAGSNAVNSLKSFFPQRRAELYVTYALTNPAAGINALVPFAQPPNAKVEIADIEFNPAAGNQAEEFICLSNHAPFAVDISNWRIEGAVEHSFAPGTVICAQDVLYVSPNVAAFRTRQTGPRGGLGLFVQGNWRGQLSARGETVRLVDAQGRPRHARTYLGAPSLAQQYLRITEIMYHPSAPGGGNSGTDDLEFIELKNISPQVSLNLAGVRFETGIAFQFSSSVSNTLAPGASVLLVKNLAAFTSHYAGSSNIAGVYSGSLDNSGERLRLVDAGGEEILDFKYEPTWYPLTDGHGFSLVVVHETAEPDAWSKAVQWRVSGRLSGSPGGGDPLPPAWPGVVINEALTRTDSGAPGDQIELWNPGAIPADISGWFLSDDFNTPKKFRIPNGTVIPAGGFQVFSEADFNAGGAGFALGSDGDEVWLFSADPGGNLTGYVHGFAFGAADDLVSFGRHVTSTGEEHFVAQTSRTLGTANSMPRVGPVVITEIMYHPPGLPAEDNAARGEFLELANISAQTTPLYDPAFPAHAWMVSGGIHFIFPANQTLNAGEVLLLVNFDPSTNAAQTSLFRDRHGIGTNVALLGPYAGQLANDGEAVALLKPAAPVLGQVPYVLVDQVGYHDRSPWPEGADGFGLSLQRRDPLAYGDDPANWIAAAPTPGRSNPAMGLAPKVTLPPQSQTTAAGGNAAFSVLAEGDAPLRYQWQFNGQNLPGATNALLNLTNLHAGHVGEYQVMVYNDAGSSLSGNATLTLRYPAVILAPPQSVTLRGSTNAADYGSTTNRSATFALIIHAEEPLKYQWRRNGALIPGANSPSLTLSNVTLADDGVYEVTAADNAGSALNASARLTVLVSPTIVLPPTDQYVVQGGSFTASVVAGGNPPPFNFLWRQGNTTLSVLRVSDSQCFFTRTNLQPAHAGLYRVIVTNAALTGLQVNATFNVIVLPDTDSDGLPDEWELAFFDSTTAAAGGADADGDSATNRDEYQAGTDPTDPLSYLKVEKVDFAGTAHIVFGAVSNRTYTVQWSDQLESGSWSNLAHVIARPLNRIESVVDSSPNARRFYRLVTPRQP